MRLTVDGEKYTQPITLKLDPVYWPSYELRRDGHEWRRMALN